MVRQAMWYGTVGLAAGETAKRARAIISFQRYLVVKSIFAFGVIENGLARTLTDARGGLYPDTANIPNFLDQADSSTPSLPPLTVLDYSTEPPLFNFPKGATKLEVHIELVVNQTYFLDAWSVFPAAAGGETLKTFITLEWEPVDKFGAFR